MGRRSPVALGILDAERMHLNKPLPMIFITYSDRDRAFAERVARMLEDFPVAVWFHDWVAHVGRSQVDVLHEALDSCACLLIIIGPGGLSNSARVKTCYALSKHPIAHPFRIVPVLAPGTDTDNIPDFLRSLVYLDLRERADERVAQFILTLDNVEIGKRTPKVFLCHAQEDKTRIAQLHVALKAAAIDAWYDETELRLGELWAKVIIGAIRDADFFALFLSKSSANKTGFVQRELRTAIVEFQHRPEGTPYILPIRLEDCDIPGVRLDVNTSLTDLQWLDIFENDHLATKRIVDTIRRQWQSGADA